MKKMLLLVALFLLLSVVYGLYNPVIDYAYINNGTDLIVVGTGFGGGINVNGKIGDMVVPLGSVNEKELRFVDLFSEFNGNFQVSVDKKVLNNDKYQTYNSNTILFFSPIAYKLETVKVIGKGAYYDITVTLNELPYNKKKLSIIVNGKTYTSDAIMFDGNSLTVNYDTLTDSTYRGSVSVMVKYDGKILNTLGDYLQNDLILSLDKIWVEKEKVFVKIKVSYPDYKKVYLDDIEKTSNQYKATQDTLIFEFSNTDTTFEHNIYVENAKGPSNRLYFDLHSYIVPLITSIVLEKGNSFGEKIHVNGENLGFTNSDVVMIINGKEYKTSVEKDSRPVFDGKLYNFDLVQGIRYDFNQPILFNTGTDNSIQVKVKNRVSNIIKFIAQNSNRKTDYFMDKSGIQKSQLSMSFEPSEKKGDQMINSGIFSSQKYNLGKLKISGGSGMVSYYFDKIIFSLKIKESGTTLDLSKLELGNKDGYIKKIDSENYDLIFEDILIKKLTSTTMDLNISLSDNIKILKFAIKPSFVKYQDISTREQTINKMFDNTESNASFQSISSNCFDSKSDYSNCKLKGYTKGTSYAYLISKSNIGLNTSSSIVQQNSSEIKVDSGPRKVGAKSKLEQDAELKAEMEKNGLISKQTTIKEDKTKSSLQLDTEKKPSDTEKKASNIDNGTQTSTKIKIKEDKTKSSLQLETEKKPSDTEKKTSNIDNGTKTSTAIPNKTTEIKDLTKKVATPKSMSEEDVELQALYSKVDSLLDTLDTQVDSTSNGDKSKKINYYTNIFKSVVKKIKLSDGAQRKILVYVAKKIKLRIKDLNE